MELFLLLPRTWITNRVLLPQPLPISLLLEISQHPRSSSQPPAQMLANDQPIHPTRNPSTPYKSTSQATTKTALGENRTRTRRQEIMDVQRGYMPRIINTMPPPHLGLSSPVLLNEAKRN
eukprot:TRINITY_DN64273_c0_g1_i1.p1 TRINITY_DN64273_c0_g1~~TRINITY_DN64273_c0_g1_i1.p1  ORF type:complete len:120 (+),score=7.48 TRINITY_DN64273_c0_g1_i1:166-525(+)